MVLREPWRFDFFQAVRLLERLVGERAPRPPVGEDAVPGREVVRFRSLPSLSFPASPVAHNGAPLVTSKARSTPSGVSAKILPELYAPIIGFGPPTSTGPHLRFPVLRSYAIMKAPSPSAGTYSITALPPTRSGVITARPRLTDHLRCNGGVSESGPTVPV